MKKLLLSAVAALAKWADGKLELGPNSGILLMMEKEPAK